MPDLTTLAPESTEKSRREADGLSLLEQLAEPSAAQVSTDAVIDTVLKKLKLSAQKRCRNPKAPILFGRANDRSMALVHKAKCGCWACSTCGARNARRAIARCLNHINSIGGQWYFATITAHENWHVTPEASYKNITTNWHKLRKRLREIHGGQFSYFRVWEHHKDGTFHMHLITNCELPYKTKVLPDGKIKYTCALLKKHARRSGMGYMVDYQPLDNAGFAAHYVAKYMSKSITDSSKWIKGMRRYQTSGDWISLPDLSKVTEFDWTYMKNSTHVWYECHSAADEGFEIYLAHSGKKVKNASVAVDFYLGVRKMDAPENSKPFYEQEWFKQHE